MVQCFTSVIFASPSNQNMLWAFGVLNFKILKLFYVLLQCFFFSFLLAFLVECKCSLWVEFKINKNRTKTSSVVSYFNLNMTGKLLYFYKTAM